MATSSTMSASNSMNLAEQAAEEEEDGPTRDHQDGQPASGTGRNENVKVMVRCRPLAGKELGSSACLEVSEDSGCVQVLDGPGREFCFDAVFGPQSNSERVYMRSCRHLIEAAFEGYQCTVFLYGQTGTGKTYTHSSLTLNSFAHLFSLIKRSNSEAQFLIRASYYELYNEDIRDLLAPKSQNSDKPLELRESKVRGVYVKNLTNYLVSNLNELEKLKRAGDERRATAATKMNEHSSRSHSIFSITIERIDSSPPTASGANSGGGGGSSITTGSIKSVRVGRLNLIDLAGSERQSKSGSTGARLKEASRINLSLTCLSLVIRSLTDPNSGHVPYRNSKLTRLLTSSLGGNSKTLLIACISPAKAHLDETLNTLRFASRTKRVKNRAKINEDAKDALLRKYRAQLEELRLKLRTVEQKSSSSAAAAAAAVTDDDAIESLAGAANQESQLMQQQLKLLKAKIMVGGENLLDKLEMHEKLLEASRNELEERKEAASRLKQKLQLKQEAIERMNSTRGSLESQARALDEKLKRALELYRQTKEEQKDFVCEHQQLKDSLLQSIRTTSKEIKYADCIIDDFIPRQYLDLINAYAQYDDESDEWQIKYIALSGNNIAQTKRFVGFGADYQHVLDGAQFSNDSSCRPDPFIRLEDLANLNHQQAQ